MAENVLDLVERLWTGATSTETHHPVTVNADLVEVADRTSFIPAFGNVCGFGTDDGLVLVDTGSQFLARKNHEKLRRWSSGRLDTAIFSHGHIDHVFGVGPFEEEAASQGWQPPRVIAHEHLPARFDRYIATAGYNGIINQRQFQLKAPFWPTEYRYPDETYVDDHHVTIGGEAFDLQHDKGETDDATWVWNPQRKVLCTGDLFIWASPNCGNPQKVQRYPREWAEALRKMLTLDPDVLLPGHGFPIVGADRIRQALGETADLLESLLEQTLRMMNEGARLDDIVHSVEAPAHLLERPYLRPVYDEPEFVVRNIWRLYGGWYDGNPANLKPARDADLAAEVAALAGSARRLADRAVELADAGELRLAGHLAEMAALAAPEDAGIHAVRADVFGRRADAELSTMSKGVFAWAAKESSDHATGS